VDEASTPRKVPRTRRETSRDPCGSSWIDTFDDRLRSRPGFPLGVVARFVVCRRIDSTSLNPDTVVETIRLDAAVEEEQEVVVDNALRG
jgi:hypothetical protein